MNWRSLFLAPAILAIGVACASAETTRGSADRVLLTNGETADVLSRLTTDGEKYRHLILLRDEADTAVSASFTGDYAADVFEIRLREANAGATIRIWYDLGFHKSGMKMPLVVEVNGERFRSLVDDSSSASREDQKMRAAVRKLPASFLTAIRRLCAIADGGDLDVPTTAILERLLEGSPPAAVHVAQKTSLSEAEISALQARVSKR